MINPSRQGLRSDRHINSILARIISYISRCTVTVLHSAKSFNIAELQWRFARDTLFLAHDSAGRVIGQAWIEDVGKDAYLYKLSVDPSIQGGGIGKALVEAACAHAEKAGKANMRLHVRVELTGNIAFFKSRGFEIAGEGVHDGYDRTTFWKMARPLQMAKSA